MTDAVSRRESAAEFGQQTGVDCVGLPGLSVAWAERIIVRDQQYMKIFRARPKGGRADDLTDWEVPLFTCQRQTRKAAATNNVWIDPALAQKASFSPDIAELDFSWAELEELSAEEFHAILRPMGFVQAPTNPFLKFRQGKSTVVLDTISLLQFAVAPNERCFEMLLSPFREIAAWGAKRRRLSLLNVWPAAFRSPKDEDETGHNCLSRASIRALAFWVCSSAGVSVLEQISHALRAGQSLTLPKVSLRVHACCDGWKKKGVFVVQSIRTQRGGAIWAAPGEVIVALNRTTRRPSVVADTPHSAIDVSYELFGEDIEESSIFRNCRSPREAELLLENYIKGDGMQPRRAVRGISRDENAVYATI